MYVYAAVDSSITPSRDFKMCTDIEDLDKFVAENDLNFSLEDVEVKAKEIILEKCRKILEGDSSSHLYVCLCCIRILTRDEVVRKELTSNFFVSLLLKHAFHRDTCSQSSGIKFEALKSLCNIVFKEPCVIDRLKELNVVRKIMEGIEILLGQVTEKEQLLLCLKLAFLVTALDSSSRQEMVNFNTLQLLIKVLKMRSGIADSTIAAEALKTIYNILYSIQDEDVTKELDDDIQNLVVILKHLLQDSLADNFDNYLLVSQTVNVLNVIPKKFYRSLLNNETIDEHRTGNAPEHSLPGTETNKVNCIAVLVSFLHSQLKLDATKVSGTASDLRTDERICPILNCLTRACKSNRQIRKFCRLKVLPYLGKDVTRLPEDGDSIRNHLCKLLTHPVQIVGESAALFIFVLCKENIGRAVKYTGFGNFAGFLARHALLGKTSKNNKDSNYSNDEYSDTSSESETEEYKSLKDDVNPVTGRWEISQPNPMENMSEEQKEYLAMDLVQKIDKLERSGFIQPGTIGEDGCVRPVHHILELIQTKEDDKKSEESSD